MTKPSEVELVTTWLELCPRRFAAAAACLSEAEHARAARFRAERDRRRFIAARGRLRQLLAERLGTVPESIAFAYGSNGKPALAPPFARSGWRFNVSHCEDLALYAFSRGGEVGVDVEAMRPLPEADAIAAQVLTPAERARYRSLAPHERAGGVLRCWTRKEALVKARGEGLRAPLAELDVTAAPPGWRLESFVPEPGFIAALAHR